MKKWGKILSQSDTFDGDYLKKNRMRKSDSSDASLDSNGKKIVAAGSAVVLIGLWRALAVGSLHGYHTIRVRFLQSRGLPLTEAGATLAA